MLMDTRKYVKIRLLFLLTCDRKYGLDDNTVDFIGHALALHRDDHYLDEPALDTVKRMKVSIQGYCILVLLSLLWILLNWKFHLFHLFLKLYFVYLFMAMFPTCSYMQSLLHAFKGDHLTYILCMV